MRKLISIAALTAVALASPGLAAAQPDVPVSGQLATGLAATAAANQVGYGEIRVTWTAPADSAPTGVTVSYRLQYEKGNDVIGVAAMTVDDVTSPHTITGLENGEQYAIRLFTIHTNTAGSTPSAPSAVVTATTRTVPTPPQVTGLMLTAGDGMITAKWNAVTYPVSGIMYNVMTTATGFSSTVTTGETMLEIGSLTNGTEYTVKVWATHKGAIDTTSDPANPTGKGPDSAEKKETPMAAEPPGPTEPAQVTGVTVDASTANQIMVSWTAPADGGSPITGYTVSRMMMGGETVSATADADATSHTFMNVDAGEYTVTVAAVNAQGTGTASAAMTATVTDPAPPAATEPAQVTGVTLNVETANQIMVSWTAPADGGSPITMYSVSRMMGDQTVTETAAAGATSHTFMKVPAGMYSVTVSAQNAVGMGMKSEAMTATVMDPAPDPDPDPDPTPTPALPLAGILALGGVLGFIGRRRVQQRLLNR